MNMTSSERTVYINGEWLPESKATVSIFDRGFLFADAIYEVTAVANGKIFDFDRHTSRLIRSLQTLDIPIPLSELQLLEVYKKIAVTNNLNNGSIYLQISRGAENRSFLFSKDLTPTVVIFTQPREIIANPIRDKGIKVKSTPDLRWANRHIKTVQLLNASLSKVEAVRKGFDDALFIEKGFITECAAANFHFVTKKNVLITRGLSNALLHGVTRGSILEIAAKAGLKVEERNFTLEETLTGSEAFITDSLNLVMPVVSIDNLAIGDGVPGPIAKTLLTHYLKSKLETGIDIHN
ncbi:D-alanine aminotransferase [Pseudomonas sp. AD21]|uniref:aminotransferase class IV n=1 Tax=Pseudomonas sp. AD21 TaxID=396378 RepID=UPI000C8294D2|nr:aminotransferase class IV [Pseudomonas sp. AD21]PMQ11576.1 D-alanine aminotransferase [Pseudomonas sp. AD21]